MSKEHLRNAILDAAERAINAKGLSDTKMDDIAREAGISKGGVFYHFASKRLLLLAIIERYEQSLFALRDRYYNELPDQPFRKLKAMLLALGEHPNRKKNNSAAILALLADKDVRRAIGALKEKLSREILDDAPDPSRAALALIIHDGMWVSELFGTNIYPAAVTAAIMDDLLGSFEIARAEAPCS